MLDRGKHHLWILNTIMNMIAKSIFVLANKMTPFNNEIFVKNKKSWQNNLFCHSNRDGETGAPVGLTTHGHLFD